MIVLHGGWGTAFLLDWIYPIHQTAAWIVHCIRQGIEGVAPSHSRTKSKVRRLS